MLTLCGARVTTFTATGGGGGGGPFFALQAVRATATVTTTPAQIRIFSPGGLAGYSPAFVGRFRSHSNLSSGVPHACPIQIEAGKILAQPIRVVHRTALGARRGEQFAPCVR